MLKRNLAFFLLFLAVAAGVVGSQYLFGWSKGSFLNPTPPLEISVIYSPELDVWLQPATDAFNAQKHKLGGAVVHVSIEAVEDGEALRSIDGGKRNPTAWIPASSIWVNLLNSQWRGNHESDLLLRSGEYGTTPMALTPMVIVMYAERADAFTRKYPEVGWNQIQQAVSSPGGWADLGHPEWGQVKYSQASPTNSNAGLLAAALATYSYFGKTGGLTGADLDKADFRKWIGGLESGLVADAPPSAQQQMDDLLRYGMSRYDVVSIYESLVAQKANDANLRFGTTLKVFYPKVNIWSDYPFSTLMGEGSTADQKDAAILFKKYLYSPSVQQTALNAGFRPSNPDVPLLTNDQNNPFNKYTNIGLNIKIPRTVIADTPSGEVLNSLMRMFQR
ncbi:MAG: substrate-binding domain-containing protein [Chloroflexota bacterium]|nr:substrate-binding domain-containing protein [Chloroflexota bacterium]